MDREQVYIELKRRLKESGFSQSRIGQEAGVKQESISRFLSGKSGLSADYFLKLLAFVDGEVLFNPEIPDEGPCIKERNALRAENARLHEQIAALEATIRILREVAGLPEKPYLSAEKSSDRGKTG